ncbi:MAG: precorrin-3B C(17)-methyltransferase [Synergistaceae bacterium]|nr:precorrin-3B C(17)-methyltransferase [Synergistaceae bacterium]MBQ4430760.1 precorrin-3B C(17)-methyltransferase [Synergistaceae bacterium]MBQ7169436.1 precorrin-3B C(17)-methyltransferase [Synergistaceae bacterium]
MPVIYAVGLGPGGAETVTPQAMNILLSCDVVAGYVKYVDMIRDILPGKVFFTSGMTQEIDRCRKALEFALDGMNVALVSSGDSGVYGMAGVMMEIASGSGVDVIVIPGITAANSCASLLGAPLMNDYVTVSLSDRLTEWSVIERRLIAACTGDFVICVYNPASRHRPDNFRRACDIIAEYYAPDTPAGYVRNMGRGETTHAVMTLREIRDCHIDMFCTVIIGSSQTYILDGRMITPRGYRL